MGKAELACARKPRAELQNRPVGNATSFERFP